LYVEPHYGNPADVPARPTVFGNREFKVLARDDVPAYAASSAPHALQQLRGQLQSRGLDLPSACPPGTAMGYGRPRGFAYAPATRPPSSEQVEQWLRQRQAAKLRRQQQVGGRVGPPPMPRVHLVAGGG
jgi:hypothetical protein